MSYKIQPDIPLNLKTFTGSNSKVDPVIVAGLAILSLFTSVIWGIYNLFAGGNGSLIFILTSIILFIISDSIHKHDAKVTSITIAKGEADTLSYNLNEILTKSTEITEKILPSFESSVIRSINEAKIDLSEKAISPFWDKIEEANKYLGCYKEAVEQLIINGEVYTKALTGKAHNFPMPFPISSNVTISKNTINEFHSIIYEAHKIDGFSNIWEQRKTQKVLITGFTNLEHAINNMTSAIISAISDLSYSVKSEFKEMRNFQQIQFDSLSSSIKTTSETLTDVNNKLYYIQYNKKPNIPFIRPLIDL
jgi:hypothetical protein